MESKSLQIILFAEAFIPTLQPPQKISTKVSTLSGNKGKITFMDYNGFSGTRVGVSVDDNFYGVFDYIENEFESTPESRLTEALEVAEMGIKR